MNLSAKILLILLIIGVAACGQTETAVTSATPTIAAAANLPTATITPLPPTLDLNNTNRATNTPIPTPQPPTPTSLPTNVPPLGPPAINITSLNDNDTILMGSNLQVMGRASHPPDHIIQLTLISLNNYLLAENQAEPNDVGWQATLTIPQNISGAAKLLATIRDRDDNIVSSDEVSVYLVLDTGSTDRFLSLSHPSSGTTAVNGYNIFFDGYALFPANNTVTIAILTENCTAQIAQQNFVLGRSSSSIYWQGFVIIPPDTTGAACAVARFGTPLEDNWREAIIPINILPRTAAEAKGILIGNPPAGVRVNSGDSFLVYGTAFASDAPVQVTVMLENGRAVANTTTTTDLWGYWETAVTLPLDIEGEAEITASLGDLAKLDTYIEHKTLIQIINNEQ